MQRGGGGPRLLLLVLSLEKGLLAAGPARPALRDRLELDLSSGVGTCHYRPIETLVTPNWLGAYGNYGYSRRPTTDLPLPLARPVLVLDTVRVDGVAHKGHLRELTLALALHALPAGREVLELETTAYEGGEHRVAAPRHCCGYSSF